MPPRAVRKHARKPSESPHDVRPNWLDERSESPTLTPTFRSGLADNAPSKKQPDDPVRPDNGMHGFVQPASPDEANAGEETMSNSMPAGMSAAPVSTNSKRFRRLSSIIGNFAQEKDNLNNQAVVLDKLVCRVHKSLTIAGAITYATESIVGMSLLVVSWSAKENQLIRIFLLLRICSYLYLLWSSYDKTIDFEAAHPGLHLTWTMVHSICVVTFLSASREAFGSAQKTFMFITVIIDNLLLIITFVLLRSVRLVVDDAIKNGDIQDIHPASKRYLDFIPPATRDGDERTARHLLWQTVHVFEEVREHMQYAQRQEPEIS